MTTLVKLGETDDGIAASDIAANLAVKWHTVAGQITPCGAGDIPIGYTQDAIPSGATGTFYRAGRGNRILVATTGSPTAGYYLMCGALGVLVAETSPTTPTLFTVGQASEAAGSDALCMVSTTR